VPDYLDWDLGLGPAEMRPYHREWMQRRLWREFGTCQLGNWASQTANLAFMALKVHELWLTERGAPETRVKVTAKTSGINRLSFPFLMLGNVATQFEETLEFEPVAMKITNNSQANALLRCEYRRGWIL
jgi:hypothetical protein